MSDIGKMMFERRKELGLTLEEVGAACGVGKSTVRKWENGMIKNMGRYKIVLVAKILKLPPVCFVPSDSSFELSSDDRRLLRAFHGATPEIQAAALTMLENSAAAKKDTEPSAI